MSRRPVGISAEHNLSSLCYRLASVCYVDVRRWAWWARLANRHGLAERAAKLILDRPHESRGAFLGQVDSIVAELERILTDVAYERPPLQPPPKTSLMLPLAPPALTEPAYYLS